jgi:hypothetical protein
VNHLFFILVALVYCSDCWAVLANDPSNLAEPSARCRNPLSGGGNGRALPIQSTGTASVDAPPHQEDAPRRPRTVPRWSASLSLRAAAARHSVSLLMLDWQLSFHRALSICDTDRFKFSSAHTQALPPAKLCFEMRQDTTAKSKHGSSPPSRHSSSICAIARHHSPPPSPSQSMVE